MKKVSKIICLLVLYALGANAQNPGDNLFDETFLHEIRLENADTSVYINTKDYQELRMVIDGVVVDTIGMKRKGNISGNFSTNKFPMKVKTNKYVSGKKYDGIKEFTLHMNYQDPSMLREKMTYDICSELGLYSLRTAFAKVYLNNVYWGLYTIVEGKDEMYKQVFDHRDMDAIESLDFGNMCYISNNPVDYDFNANGGLPYYQLENGDGATAWPRFVQMMDKVNNTPDNQYLDSAGKYLNLPDFFRYQAANVYLMNFDSYLAFLGNQIYIYDTIQNIWQVQPWDFNASLGLWDTNVSVPNAYPILPLRMTTGCIASRLTTIPQLKSYYMDAMCEMVNTLCDTMVMNAKIDLWYNQIKQAVYDDTRKEISNSDFDNSVGYGYHQLFGEDIPALKTFFEARFLLMQQGLVSENYNCSTVTAIDTEQLEAKTLRLYPNPVQERLYLDLPFAAGTDYKVTVMNTLGQVVFQTQGEVASLAVEQLKSGIYFVVAQQGAEVVRGKFVKQ